jgi:hypothetical protein
VNQNPSVEDSQEICSTVNKRNKMHKSIKTLHNIIELINKGNNIFRVTPKTGSSGVLSQY